MFVIVLFVLVRVSLGAASMGSSAGLFPMPPAFGAGVGRRKASLRPCRSLFWLRAGCFSVSCGTIVSTIIDNC